MVSHEDGPFCAFIATPESVIAKRLRVGAVVVYSTRVKIDNRQSS